MGRHDTCSWARVVDGEEQIIPDTTSNISDNRDIELVADNGKYSYSDGGDPVQFIDNTFSSGGVLFDMNWTDERDVAQLSFDAIQITALTDI